MPRIDNSHSDEHEERRHVREHHRLERRLQRRRSLEEEAGEAVAGECGHLEPDIEVEHVRRQRRGVDELNWLQT